VRRSPLSRLSHALLLLALAVPALFGSALAPGAAPGLTPEERRGREIYRTGVSSAGTAITAFLADSSVEMPAAAFPCAGCHGRDGRGLPEGGVAPSDLRWGSLTKPDGVILPSGRKHPPYTESTLKRAVGMGLDSGGNKLHVAMPRFRMTHEDMAALVAYLKQLGKEGETGLGETSIRIGVVLPPAGPLSGMGAAVRAALGAKAADWNAAGGVYGRQVELDFLEAAADPAARRQQVAGFLAESQPFAVLGAFLAGADRELAELFAEREVPLIGPFTVHPREGFPLNRYVFYLLSGVETQARVVVGAALRGEAGPGRAPAIVAPEGEALDGAVSGAVESLKKGPGWSPPAILRYARAGFDPRGLARRLAEGKADPVVFLGSGNELAALATAALEAGSRPYWLATGAASDAGLLAVPVELDGRVLVAVPALEEMPAGYARFAAGHRLPADQLSAQATALAAAEVLAEALRRSGRDLTRDGLVERLEGLRNFATGFAPPVTYGAARRIGARGAYLLRLDLAARSLRPLGSWAETD
jgi:ABC-type branched-subunit amino acid transport system substrate-binding protein